MLLHYTRLPLVVNLAYSLMHYYHYYYDYYTSLPPSVTFSRGFCWVLWLKISENIISLRTIRGHMQKRFPNEYFVFRRQETKNKIIFENKRTFFRTKLKFILIYLFIFKRPDTDWKTIIRHVHRTYSFENKFQQIVYDKISSNIKIFY